MVNDGVGLDIWVCMNIFAVLRCKGLTYAIEIVENHVALAVSFCRRS